MLATQVQGQHMLMVRTSHPFEKAMAILQQTLIEYGYQVAHVQRCDGGMADFGYESDFYRVVFFGKLEEVRRLTENYPAIVPYLPLKLLVFAEQDETLLVALNPQELTPYFEGRELRTQFRRWESDIRAIMAELASD